MLLKNGMTVSERSSRPTDVSSSALDGCRTADSNDASDTEELVKLLEARDACRALRDREARALTWHPAL